MFLQETFFRMSFFFSRKLSNDKRHKKEMIKYIFHRKLQRRIFFSTRKDYQKMRSGQTLLVANAILWDFLYEIQKNRFFKKRFQKKIEKRWKIFWLKTSNDRISEKKFLEVLNKLFFCQKKKGVNFSCSKEHDWKKQMRKKVRNNKGDRTKTVLQEGMNKWKNWKENQINKGDFFERNKQKKHKRERE